MRRTRYGMGVLTLFLMITLLSACRQARVRETDPGLATAGLAPAHLPDGRAPRAPEPLWLDQARLVYPSPSGAEILTVEGGGARLLTVPGQFYRLGPAPDGNRVGYWGEPGLGLIDPAAGRPERVLWQADALERWARESVGPGASSQVAEIRWSADSRQVAFLLHLEGMGSAARSAIAVYDARSGERRLLWERKAERGRIRTFRWQGSGGLLVQAENYIGPASGHPDERTSLLLLFDNDPKAIKELSGSLPAALTLADLTGNTALFLDETGKEPPQAASLMVGLKLRSVAEAGRYGRLSPRDGQFLPLAAEQRGGALSPGGDRLAVLVGGGEEGLGIRIDSITLSALGQIDLATAQPLAMRTTPVPAGEGPPPTLVTIAFQTAQTGFGLTEQGDLYRTTDGGTTWSRLSRIDGFHPRQLRLESGRLLALGGLAEGAPSGGSGRSGEARPAVAWSDPDGAGWTVRPVSGLPEEMAQHWPHLTFSFPSAEVGYGVVHPDIWGGFALRTGILLTRDGGAAWEFRPLPDGLQAAGGIHFLTPERGFMTARSKEGSLILATRDGGATWRTVYRGEVGLYALHFADPKHGFAGGGLSPKAEADPRQLVLATRDGGETWSEVYRSQGRTGAQVAALRFDSPTTGWAALGICSMGANWPCGKGLAFTRDGGKTWQSGGSAPLSWSAVGDRAWNLGGRPSVLSRTADGGVSWQQVWHLAATEVQQLQFLNPSFGWARTNVGRYLTRDGGQTWQPLELGAPATRDSLPIFLTPGHVLTLSNRELWQSADGGRSFTEKAPLPGDGWIQAFAFAGPEQGWAVLGDGLHRTGDGGRTWERPTPGLTEQVRVLAFADSLRGVAAGRNLLLTRDGGATWSGQSLGGLSISSASYLAGGQIWLTAYEIGGDGRSRTFLLHSPDEGRNWSVHQPDSFSPEQVQFTDPQTGWMVGWSNGKAVFRTRDGGKSWEQVWLDLPR